MQQFVQQPGVADTLARRLQARGADDCRQVVDSGCKVLIDNNIVEFRPVLHFGERTGQPLRNDRGAVLPALFQSLLQRMQRRRQDEDVHGIRDQLPHLRGTLPVDLEQNILPGR